MVGLVWLCLLHKLCQTVYELINIYIHIYILVFENVISSFCGGLHSPHKLKIFFQKVTLQRRHHERDSISNHQHLHCLLSRLFGRRSKKTSKLSVTGLCDGNPPVTGEFPSQRASNVENVSSWNDMELLSQWFDYGNNIITFIFYLKAISPKTPQPSNTEIRLKITFSKFHQNLPEVNELILAVQSLGYSMGTESIPWPLIPGCLYCQIISSHDIDHRK